MKLSKKCQYALRAVLELASRTDGKPVKIQAIAEAQGIPHRFLEIILNELRHGGVVESRRGNDGGYLLARPAATISVASVIEQVEGRVSISPRIEGDGNSSGSAFGDAAFEKLWTGIDEAIWGVCDGTTFADLLELERKSRVAAVPNYSI